MSVESLVFGAGSANHFIELLGTHCPITQQMRELLENALQSGATSVFVDRRIVNGVSKLSFRDNGKGMSQDELVKYIGQIFSSGQQMSATQNFGIGAKIATLRGNPFGVEFISRATSTGPAYRVRLERDAATGVYGLHKYPGGQVWTEVSVTWKGTGTEVVLMGQGASDDTTKAPKDCPGGTMWIPYYFNSRYWDLESYGQGKDNYSITVKALEVGQQNRTVTGMKSIVQKRLDTRRGRVQGTVHITNADVEWSIVMSADDEVIDIGGKKNGALKTTSKMAPSGAQVAFRYGNELYHMALGTKAHALIRRAGIIVGCNKIVLHIIPRGEVRVDPTRTTLKINGNMLDFDSFLLEFSKKLPKEIQSLMDEISSDDTRTTISATFLQRVQTTLGSLMSVGRGIGILKKFGKDLFDGSSTEALTGSAGGGKGGGGSGDGGDGGNKDPKPGVGSNSMGVLTNLKDGRRKGERRTSALVPPTIRWLTVKNKGERIAGIDDQYVASYEPLRSEVYGNKDFEPLVRMVARLSEVHRANAIAMKVIEDTVYEEAGNRLIVAIMSHSSLYGKLEGWEEAPTKRELTLALDLVGLEEAVKKSAGRRLSASITG